MVEKSSNNIISLIKCSGDLSITLWTSRRRTLQASLWKHMMMLVSGRSERNLRGQLKIRKCSIKWIATWENVPSYMYARKEDSNLTAQMRRTNKMIFAVSKIIHSIIICLKYCLTLFNYMYICLIAERQEDNNFESSVIVHELEFARKSVLYGLLSSFGNKTT